jgi:NADH-quinone oxidoreductase subunit E
MNDNDKVKSIDKGFSVDGLIKKYGVSRSALIPVLQEVQVKYKYLPEEILEEISRKLRVPSADVYGVATFYSIFRLKPVGEIVIRVCHGTACHVGGARRITEAIETHLQIKEDQTTPDGKFTLESVACLGCCSLAPVMVVGERTYGKLSVGSAPKIVETHREGGK